MDDLKKMLIVDEGDRDKPYPDSKGKITIGIGHNLTDKGVSSAVKALMYEEDVLDAIDDVRHCFSCYDQLTRPRQLVLIGMAFNLGREKLSKFVRFIGAVHRGAFDEAADEIMDSDAARSDAPSRYARYAHMMRTDTSQWA